MDGAFFSLLLVIVIALGVVIYVSMGLLGLVPYILVLVLILGFAG